MQNHGWPSYMRVTPEPVNSGGSFVPPTFCDSFDGASALFLGIFSGPESAEGVASSTPVGNKMGGSCKRELESDSSTSDSN